MKCKVCGHSEFRREYQTASSDLACANCGAVVEENPIVSEVTFAETSSGAATVQGAFVGSDQSRANFGNNRGSLDSREQTLANGKRRIKEVAASLRISDTISDAAYSWFRLALANNFVQGRRSQTVVAACLYVACRKEETHHMLIDFSSRLQISVYAVGATFLKMVKALHIIDIPVVDPSIFIQHFAERLNFGTKKKKVILDARRLARRMSEDWINQGRRPAGIAGACILLAARMNNFRRTHAEIVSVTHVSEATIQQRLNEFKFAHNSNVSVKEFRVRSKAEEDLMDKAHNLNISVREYLKRFPEEKVVKSPSTLPPSFMKSRLNEDVLRDRLHTLKENSDEALMKDPILATFLSDSKLTESEIQDSIKRALKRQTNDGNRLLNTVLNEEEEDKRAMEANVLANREEENVSIQLKLNKKRYELEKQQKAELELLEFIEKNRPRNLAQNLPSTDELLKKVKDDPVDLDDIDDDEIDSFLLTAEESQIKERIWTGTNQDFLLQLENKRLKEEADRVAGHNQHPKKKRKSKSEGEGGDLVDQLNSNNSSNKEFNEYLGKNTSTMGFFSAVNKLATQEGISAADSAKIVLGQKGLSNKINYDAINNLFDD